MRIYKEDIDAIRSVITFLENFNEPEGFFLYVAVRDDTGSPQGEFQYRDNEWSFVVSP